mgnify:CR=1 FL=1
MQQLIPINILIGDRTYRIRIEPENEETVRKTVKLVNEKILEFKTAFAGKDMQDYTAMVLIWYATAILDTPSADLPGQKLLEEKLAQFESGLDKALRE